MFHGIAVAAVVVGLLGQEPAPPRKVDLDQAPAPRPPAEVDPTDLSQEVAALRTLHLLQPTPEQRAALAKLAGDTAMKPVAGRAAPMVSKDFRRTLADLHRALVAGDDPDKITDLCTKLDDLREQEKPELDDVVTLTAAARRQGPRVARLFRPRQLALYLGSYGEATPDPLALLLDALDGVRDLETEAAEELRDRVAEEVGWLVAGLDEEAAATVAAKAAAWFNQARRLRDRDFKRLRPRLEEAAADLAGAAAPMEVLRHVVERDLAELLANPRLAAALRALEEREKAGAKE